MANAEKRKHFYTFFAYIKVQNSKTALFISTLLIDLLAIMFSGGTGS